MNFIRDTWDIIWSMLHWFQICTFVDEWDGGVLLRRGKYQRTVGPGIVWHLPMTIDEIFLINVKPTALELAEQSVTTYDNIEIVCKGVIMWGVFDAKKALVDVESAEETLGDIAVGVIHEMVEDNEWEYIRSAEFRTDMKKAIQKQARKWGISVTAAKFQDLTRARAYRVFGGLK